MHCYYLRDKYDISYLCFDSGKKKIGMDGIKIIYISSGGYYFIRGIRFMIYSLFRSFFFRGIIFVFYFPGSEWYKKLLPLKKMILDIRTGGVCFNLSENLKFNLKLTKTALLYDHITVLAKGLADKLKLPPYKTTIVPLGANPVSKIKKRLDTLRLFYIGTLSDRNIEKTIYGLSKFVELHRNIKITYDIVGDGYYNEVEKFKKLSDRLGLQDIVKIHGSIPYTKTKPFFDNCNIGVSFVPISDAQEYQPITKTYEYIMSGIYTIATATYENKRVINEQNGIVIKDSSDDFCRALTYISENREKISMLNISNTLTEYKWSNIVNNTLYPLLTKLEKEWF